eukprot:EG_transcript_889
MGLLRAVLRDFPRQVHFSFTYINNEVAKNKGPFYIGISTVVIMVFLIAALLAGSSKTPGLFVMLAEDQTGEVDVLLTPALQEGSLQFLNATQIRRRLLNDTEVSGVVPRWVMNGRLTDRYDADVGVSTVVLAIDTRREQRIPIGRKWRYRVLGEGEMHVRDSILRQLGVEANVGDKLALSIDFSRILSQSVEKGTRPTPALTKGLLSPFLARVLNVSETDTFRINLRAILQALGYPNNPVKPRQATVPLRYLLDRFAPFNASQLTLLAPLLDLPQDATWTDLYGLLTNQPPDANITLPLPGDGSTDPFGFLPGGDSASVRLTLPEILALKVQNDTVEGILLKQLLDFRVEYTVADAITASVAKYPAALGNIAVVDAEHLLGTFLSALALDRYGAVIRQYSDLPVPTSKQVKQNFEISDYALMVYSMAGDRQAMYTQSAEGRNAAYIHFTNRLFSTLGVDWPANFQAPVMWTLGAFEYLRLFLDQIVMSVIVVFVVLSALVVFTLLLSNADAKTYEYGMLRALGLPHRSLWILILYQAVLFSVPGIALGLACAFAFGSGLEAFMTHLTGFRADFTPPLSWIFASSLGVLVPMVASVEPIRRALSNTLRNSLDVYHSANQQTNVVVLKLQEYGVAGWQTSLAVLMISVGFMVYYVLPFAFLFENLPLFFGVLNLLLLGMLLGLAVIAQALQSYLQSLFVSLLLWGRDRKLRDLVRKNMTAHGQRSKKTHLMFTLTMAIIIFGGVVFALQTRSIIETVKIFVGVDIRVDSSNRRYPLQQAKIAHFLTQEKARGVVGDFAFATFPLDSYSGIVDDTHLTTLMEFPSNSIDLIGLDRNYLNVVFDYYMQIADRREDTVYRNTRSGDWDVIDALYEPLPATSFVPSDRLLEPLPPNFTDRTKDRYMQVLPVLLTSAAREPMSATVRSTLELRLDLPSIGPDKWLVAPYAFLTKLPGYVFSSYSITLSSSPVIVSMPTFERLLRQSAAANPFAKASVMDELQVEMKSLFVRLGNNVSTTQRIDLINGLRAYIDPTFHTLQDTVDLEAVATSTSDSIMLVYYVIALFGILLCTFMLWLSFKANVMHNTWEFGVIRAIGLDVDAVVRVYVYEAICLVLSGFTLGSSIGIFVALTLSLQFNLFTEMKLQFTFPFVLFGVTVAASFLAAVFGSYSAARPLKSKRIVSVLKGI